MKCMDELRPASINTSKLLHTSFVQEVAVAQNYSIDTSRAKTNKQVVSICAAKLGLREYPDGRNDGATCDIYWHNIIYQDMRNIIKNPHTKINKFPGMSEITKKISLTRSISSMHRLFPEEYQFYPSSWFIPAQLDAFIEHCNYKKQQNGSTSHYNKTWYIVKPDDGAQGSGIYLIQRPEQIKKPEVRQLVQEYVTDPYLMNDNLKFDLRVYAVIKSINPLSIYIAREGMVRFCTEQYAEPTSSNFENLYAHLTNYSLNKENSAYIHSLSLRDQIKGSKRLLSTVFYQMESRGVKTKQLWHDIKLIVVKTVIAMLPEIILSYEHYFYDTPGPQCFQIMGFDVLITKNLKPLLLEVNSAPSLTIEHHIPNPSEEKENVESPTVRSVVDEVYNSHKSYVWEFVVKKTTPFQAIKIPLVRDTILLVLNLIENVYEQQNLSNSASLNNPNWEVMNDITDFNTKKKCHLIEIFPCRYRQDSGHLLFLDKAVYLFMQFVNLKQTTVITVSGARAFLKKCNLLDAITMEAMEYKYIEIYKYFTANEYVPYVSGLSFHGFLYLLYHIAQLKFPVSKCLLEQMQQLLAYCDMSLRHYGVRSSRLRRAQINRENRNVEIYLLPSRINNRRLSRTETRLELMERSRIRQQYGRSLPRTLGRVVSKPNAIGCARNQYKCRGDELILPRIRHPFRF